jgi:hypothetical protein
MSKTIVWALRGSVSQNGTIVGMFVERLCNFRPALGSPKLLILPRCLNAINSRNRALPWSRKREPSKFGLKSRSSGSRGFLSAAGAKIAATCVLITAPHLLRAGRQHGFVEIVVTLPGFRADTRVVHAGLRRWAKKLLSRLPSACRNDPRVHHFHESCGFDRGLLSLVLRAVQTLDFPLRLGVGPDGPVSRPAAIGPVQHGLSGQAGRRYRAI